MFSPVSRATRPEYGSENGNGEEGIDYCIVRLSLQGLNSHDKFRAERGDGDSLIILMLVSVYN